VALVTLGVDQKRSELAISVVDPTTSAIHKRSFTKLQALLSLPDAVRMEVELTSASGQSEFWLALLQATAPRVRVIIHDGESAEIELGP
jgi:hypothetical protein